MIVFCIAWIWTMGAGELHAQDSVVKMGCCLFLVEGCIRPSAWGGPLSFYPITLQKRKEAFVEHAQHGTPPAESNAKREEVRCRCIEKAIAEYARTWVDLQSGDITPEKAKSKLTLHLTCAPCGRWEDLENLLSFIDAELAQQRVEKH